MPAVPAPLPTNEAQRLSLLRSYDVLDTEPELPYNDLVLVASQICETPIALVSLVDEDRQWFKARRGLDASETSRDLAFCAHAILDDALFEIPDAREDPRFSGNPLVTADPRIRFYAGAPLVVGEDLRVGTLCVIDRQPRQLDDTQREALRALARQTVAQLELRRLLAAERRLRAERELVLEELRSVAELRSKLLATVSHEMRTPLTAMKGSLELLAIGALEPLGPSALNTVQIAQRSTSRLIRLTNDLLEAERLGEATPLELQDFELVPLLAAARAQLANLKPGVSIETEIDPEAPRRAHGDSDRIEQVVLNYLANAIRFSEAGQRVTLRVRPGEELPIRIEVEDQGPGLSEADQEGLFHPFVQRGTAEQRRGGSGLGLSICRTIAKLHGGRVGCVSQPGAGSTFFLELPAAQGC